MEPESDDYVVLELDETLLTDPLWQTLGEMTSFNITQDLSGSSSILIQFEFGQDTLIIQEVQECRLPTFGTRKLSFSKLKIEKTSHPESGRSAYRIFDEEFTEPEIFFESATLVRKPPL